MSPDRPLTAYFLMACAALLGLAVSVAALTPRVPPAPPAAGPTLEEENRRLAEENTWLRNNNAQLEAGKKAFLQAREDARAEWERKEKKLTEEKDKQDEQYNLLWRITIVFAAVVAATILAAIIYVPRYRRYQKQDQEREDRLKLARQNPATQRASFQDGRPASADLGRARRVAEDERDKVGREQQKAQEDRTAAEKARDVARREGEAAKANLAQAEAERQKAQEDHTAAEKARDVARREGEAAKANLAQAEAERQKAQEDHTAAEKARDVARREGEAAKANLAQAEAERQKAQEDHTAAELEHSKAAAVLQRVTNLCRTMWPAWATDDSLKPSLTSLAEAEQSGDQNAAIALAQLHVFHVADGAGREHRYLAESGRELGRFLLAYLAQQNLPPAEAVEHATHWARALNQAATQRLTVVLPRVGDPFDVSWMIARPGTKTVSRVLNWAVRDAKGVTTYKAEVE